MSNAIILFFKQQQSHVPWIGLIKKKSLPVAYVHGELFGRLAMNLYGPVKL